MYERFSDWFDFILFCFAKQIASLKKKGFGVKMIKKCKAFVDLVNILNN